MIDFFLRLPRFEREDFIALCRGDSSAMLSPRTMTVNLFLPQLLP